MAQIKKSTVMDSGTSGEKQRLLEAYKGTIETQQMLKLVGVTYEETKVANGYQFFVHLNGALVVEWYLLHNRFGWELGNVTYVYEKVA